MHPATSVSKAGEIYTSGTSIFQEMYLIITSRPESGPSDMPAGLLPDGLSQVFIAPISFRPTKERLNPKLPTLLPV